MRELSQIDQELRQVRRDLDRAGKLDAMLADLGKQHLQQRKKAAEAFERLNRAEEKEAFLASGREAEHENGKLRRDKQEVAQARARYEEAEWDLRDLEDRLWDVKEERAKLEQQESRYQALLKEKEQYLCCTGSSQVPRLVEIAREMGTADCLIREEQEALQAGEEAQARLKELAGALEQAKGRGWDMPGGYISMQTVQAYARDTRSALSRLRTELAGLTPKDVPLVDLEGYSAFADCFLEQLFSDLFEPEGEKQTREGVTNTLCEVEALVDGLRRELEGQKNTKQSLQQEREKLLAGI